MHSRTSRPLILVLVALSSLLTLLATACGGGGGEGGGPAFGLNSELVTSIDFPSALAFTPDGRLFFTERNLGDVRIITPGGKLLDEPFAHVDVAQGFEWGLLAAAIDPDFATNHFVYVYYTRLVDPQNPKVAQPVLARFTEANNKATEPAVLLELPPTDPEHPYYHAGSSIEFGPDGYLYLTVGDYDKGDIAQDLAKLPGKILRLNKADGSAAPDNPFVDDPNADPRIFAYGFRKAYDLAFEPQTGGLFAPDNNRSTCDELNLVRAGRNYGWPLSREFEFADCNQGQQTPPIYFFARPNMKPLDNLSTVFPTGVAFVSGQRYPKMGAGLLVCQFTTHLMRRLVI
ncbi:MAG TPA: PQQ-dependent sugar dehydrogenase, partial [Dehalococcoidia bacterium]|nr:PQQ-dependent sugar dehydrogenase [Dehalococcoidia bacterium]